MGVSPRLDNPVSRLVRVVRTAVKFPTSAVTTTDETTLGCERVGTEVGTLNLDRIAGVSYAIQAEYGDAVPGHCEQRRLE